MIGFEDLPATEDDYIDKLQSYWEQLLMQLEREFPDKVAVLRDKGTKPSIHTKGNPFALIRVEPHGVIQTVGGRQQSTESEQQAVDKFKQKVEALPDYKNVCAKWVEMKRKKE